MELYDLEITDIHICYSIYDILELTFLILFMIFIDISIFLKSPQKCDKKLWQINIFKYDLISILRFLIPYRLKFSIEIFMFYYSIKIISLENTNTQVCIEIMIVIICNIFEKNGVDVISWDILNYISAELIPRLAAW